MEIRGSPNWISLAENLVSGMESIFEKLIQNAEKKRFKN